MAEGLAKQSSPVRWVRCGRPLGVLVSSPSHPHSSRLFLSRATRPSREASVQHRRRRVILHVAASAGCDSTSRISTQERGRIRSMKLNLEAFPRSRSLSVSFSADKRLASNPAAFFSGYNTPLYICVCIAASMQPRCSLKLRPSRSSMTRGEGKYVESFSQKLWKSPRFCFVLHLSPQVYSLPAMLTSLMYQQDTSAFSLQRVSSPDPGV